MGQNRKAVESYDKALEINPEFAQAHSNRGKALSELGQDQEAIVSCNQAIEINPDYAMAYFNRGNALKNLKLFLSVAQLIMDLALAPEGVSVE